MAEGRPTPTTRPIGQTSRGADIGLHPFDALAITIASVELRARGFSGDPDGLADLISRRRPLAGFRLFEVMSPCVPFRPEQRRVEEDQVRAVDHDGRAGPRPAAALVLADDGHSSVFLFRRDRAPFAPAMQPQSRSPIRTRVRIGLIFLLLKIHL